MRCAQSICHFWGSLRRNWYFCTKKKEERPPGLSPTDGLWPVCDKCNNARDYNTVKLLFDAYSEAITITDKHCGNTPLEYVLEGEGILHWYVDEQSKVINFLETQLDLIEDNVSTTTMTTHGWLSLSLHWAVYKCEASLGTIKMPINQPLLCESSWQMTNRSDFLSIYLENMQ